MVISATFLPVIPMDVCMEGYWHDLEGFSEADAEKRVLHSGGQVF